MQDWTKFTDEEVFTKAGEQPGSQAAYWRDTEIRRRDYFLNQTLLQTQIDAVEAQRTATAIMKQQSVVLAWTAGFAALSAVASLATALVTYLVAK
jgi:hypothetical protein